MNTNRIPAVQKHPTDTTPLTHCAHGVRLSRVCFDCPTGRVCPDCGGGLMDPAPAGQPGDDSYYCEGCGKAWSLHLIDPDRDRPAPVNLHVPFGPRANFVTEPTLTPSGRSWYQERIRVGCWECGGFDGVTAPERLVLSTFVTNPADPTTAYRLVCGHSAI